MQYYSYSYVGDVVSAIILILDKGASGEAYNIADSKSDIRLKDLANLIASVGNKKVIFELPNETEKKGFSKATKAIINPTKLNNLGYIPITHIEDGIKNTIIMLKEKNHN
jgi:nucleoside-diphosphate-sugar epimerase